MAGQFNTLNNLFGLGIIANIAPFCENLQNKTKMQENSAEFDFEGTDKRDFQGF